MQLTAQHAPVLSTPKSCNTMPCDRPPTQVKGRADKWAGRVSIIFSPPTAGAAGLLAVAAHINTPEAWAWSLADILLTVILPLLFVVWLVQTGRASDLDLCRRDQRKWPYRVMMLSSAVSIGLSLVFGGPPLLTILVGALAVQTLLLSLITMAWKISLHTAAIAGTAAVAWYLAGAPALILALLTPVVAWARVRLGRHDVPQTVAGALVGAATFTATFALLPAL
ncbi:MAG: hypothetical protein RMN25_10270 [Anaerolineae bacterium]|nr:hypothetical protein [Thermoflexales bacterium]MDW8408152.1 hypothetical protein [Anaerolineae bacterium]